MTELTQRHCKPCEGGVTPLDAGQANALLSKIQDWSLSDDAKTLSQTFRFKNYYHTMAFVNAVAWIAHQEDHHPDMTVSYNRCQVTYSTHSIGGLSDNDFICAAKVDALQLADS